MKNNFQFESILKNANGDNKAEINLKIALFKLNTSQYLSRIEGSPPKRNVAGSIPVWDASKQR